MNVSRNVYKVEFTSYTERGNSSELAAKCFQFITAYLPLVHFAVETERITHLKRYISIINVYIRRTSTHTQASFFTMF